MENRSRVLVLTADPELAHVARTAVADAQVDLALAANGLADAGNVESGGAAVLVVDLDAGRPEDVTSLQRLVARLERRTAIIVVAQTFTHDLARRLLQLRIADFLVKPVAPIDLARACARVAQPTPAAEPTEAQIHTFLPAAGGVGVTTLAIQTALLLLRGGARNAASTCLIDLDFQHGACADYLDLEPRLDLGEIEPRPERLDHQLLEVMLSHHSSGLALIAAPNRPAEMRSFDANVVTRLLDLASSRFEHVVIDMPRVWFSWTDNVLVGSNMLLVVTEATVPGLRHARNLVSAIKERLGAAAQPRVVVNRFEQRWFGPGLRRAEIKQALGDAFAGTIPNNYRLVREAIDRGVPLEDINPKNNVAAELRKLINPRHPAVPAPAQGGASRIVPDLQRARRGAA